MPVDNNNIFNALMNTGFTFVREVTPTHFLYSFKEDDKLTVRLRGNMYKSLRAESPYNGFKGKDVIDFEDTADVEKYLRTVIARHRSKKKALNEELERAAKKAVHLEVEMRKHIVRHGLDRFITEVESNEKTGNVYFTLTIKGNVFVLNEKQIESNKIDLGNFAVGLENLYAVAELIEEK